MIEGGGEIKGLGGVVVEEGVGAGEEKPGEEGIIADVGVAEKYVFACGVVVVDSVLRAKEEGEEEREEKGEVDLGGRGGEVPPRSSSPIEREPILLLLATPPTSSPSSLTSFSSRFPFPFLLFCSSASLVLEVVVVVVVVVVVEVVEFLSVSFSFSFSFFFPFPFTFSFSFSFSFSVLRVHRFLSL